MTEAEDLVRFLSSIGLESGLFGFSKKYTYWHETTRFYVKLNSIPGDFFKIDRYLRSGEDACVAERELRELLEGLDLSPWTLEDYEKKTAESWSDQQPETLVDSHGSLHPKIRELIATYEFVPAERRRLPRPPVRDILRRQSNNYTLLEEAYSQHTQVPLLSDQPLGFKNDFSLTLSIVIPVYNGHDLLKWCLLGIAEQQLTSRQFRAVEVIVVDDGSSEYPGDAVLDQVSAQLREVCAAVKFVRSHKNLGRARARNLGLAAASGECILFLDADIVLERHYIQETMVRHQVLNDIVLVGFKENIAPEALLDERGGLSDRRPRVGADFRFSRHVEKEWVGLYPVTEEREVRCLQETNCFKDFGMGRILGPWDLPSMVVSHNVSAKREALERVGGFSTDFGRRWGSEDTWLGARLIADGNYVVPLLSTGVFHLEPESERDTGTRAAKIAELQQSVLVYQRLLAST